jgi:catechol 2,3-dioxygenase-like lactoylglutathione lyase family enzyme
MGGKLARLALDMTAGLCGNIARVSEPRKELRMPSIMRLQHTSVPMPPGGDDAARRFYGQVLGLREIPKPSGLDGMNLIWFAANDDGDEVHVFEHEGGASNPSQHLCLEVDDIAAYEAHLRSLGCEVDIPESIVNRPRLFTRDPFGNRLELVEIRGQYT